ncbi:hypothetical protein [Rhodococcus pyridinivorans]|nr:hypothetical protein [Rhodococcus pyridinivorans]
MPQAPHHPTREGQALMNLNVALLLLILMGDSAQSPSCRPR